MRRSCDITRGIIHEMKPRRQAYWTGAAHPPKVANLRGVLEIKDIPVPYHAFIKQYTKQGVNYKPCTQYN